MTINIHLIGLSSHQLDSKYEDQHCACNLDASSFCVEQKTQSELIRICTDITLRLGA